MHCKQHGNIGKAIAANCYGPQVQRDLEIICLSQDEFLSRSSHLKIWLSEITYHGEARHIYGRKAMTSYPLTTPSSAPVWGSKIYWWADETFRNICNGTCIFLEGAAKVSYGEEHKRCGECAWSQSWRGNKFYTVWCIIGISLRLLMWKFDKVNAKVSFSSKYRNAVAKKRPNI